MPRSAIPELSRRRVFATCVAVTAPGAVCGQTLGIAAGSLHDDNRGVIDLGAQVRPGSAREHVADYAKRSGTVAQNGVQQ